MWFQEIANSNNPGRDELLEFVQNVRSFLQFVVEDPIGSEYFSFLWENDKSLREEAIGTLRGDILDGASYALDQAIPNIEESTIHLHGLSGRPLRFKFRVLNSIANQWEAVKGQLSIREWFKRIVDAIDAALDSLIDAAGAGGIIKEFKDALGALA